MRVVTRDNGLQRVYWVGRRDVGYREMQADRLLRPVFIAKGSLGNDQPKQNMVVSPEHRMLIRPGLSFLPTDEELLVAVRHLINHRTIKTVGMLGVSYIHFMCSKHQVILANGAWTETFHPDDETMRGLGSAQKQELIDLFPSIETIGAARAFPAARKILKPSFTSVFRG